jgi:hypothetical protein
VYVRLRGGEYRGAAGWEISKKRLIRELNEFCDDQEHFEQLLQIINRSMNGMNADIDFRISAFICIHLRFDELLNS